MSRRRNRVACVEARFDQAFIRDAAVHVCLFGVVVVSLAPVVREIYDAFAS